MLGLRFLMSLGFAASMPWVWAQGIYVCVDDKGRKLTSDRPIPECREKEQRELNASGTTRRVVRPVMTEQEVKAQEAQKKQEQEALALAEEEKRRNRVFVQRYPNQAAHDKERLAALSQIELVSASTQSRLSDLLKERKILEAEMEFYKKDPSKAPLKLKRQIEENEKSTALQKRFAGDQLSEKARVNARFDQELTRLRTLWNAAAAPVGSDRSGAAPQSK